MRAPEYVLEKAQNRYRSVWRDALLGADPGVYTVALDPPSASAITACAGDVSAWLTRWRQWAAQHPDVTLRTRTIRTKFGAQPIHTHLDIPGTAALAGLNPSTASHWQRARARWDQLRYHQPEQAVRSWLARIIDLDNYDFTILLAATTWFRAHPRSGLTVRSVPVPGMHTKWLARHRGMVLACLGTPTDASESIGSTGDADPVDIPTDDLDALGLRPLPREISIVLADPVLRAAVGGLRQITAPVDEFARLQIHPDAVLIVENKEPALAWSDTIGLAVIHSLGNHLDVLHCLPWIPHDRCWYWGDLDRHGFTLLSRARTMVPQLTSLLMEPGDIEAYRPLGVEEDLDRYDQPDSTLTPAEVGALAAFQLTGGKYLRTEQERIPISDAEHALEQTRNHAQPNTTARPYAD
ncbi:MAG TPA: Wadjet anti-phage system protein JetD domain-containing protein [Pseudonocardiaceae bacterium]|nr:Wadjet anti-phage system protein JetD domain-containing protein [Pseudonocardiaceae bacterium]